MPKASVGAHLAKSKCFFSCQHFLFKQIKSFSGSELRERLFKDSGSKFTNIKSFSESELRERLFKDSGSEFTNI